MINAAIPSGESPGLYRLSQQNKLSVPFNGNEKERPPDYHDVDHLQTSNGPYPFSPTFEVRSLSPFSPVSKRMEAFKAEKEARIGELEERIRKLEEDLKREQDRTTKQSNAMKVGAEFIKQLKEEKKVLEDQLKAKAELRANTQKRIKQPEIALREESTKQSYTSSLKGSEAMDASNNPDQEEAVEQTPQFLVTEVVIAKAGEIELETKYAELHIDPKSINNEIGGANLDNLINERMQLLGKKVLRMLDTQSENDLYKWSSALQATVVSEKKKIVAKLDDKRVESETQKKIITFYEAAYQIIKACKYAAHRKRGVELFSAASQNNAELKEQIAELNKELEKKNREVRSLTSKHTKIISDEEKELIKYEILKLKYQIEFSKSDLFILNYSMQLERSYEKSKKLYADEINEKFRQFISKILEQKSLAYRYVEEIYKIEDIALPEVVTKIVTEKKLKELERRFDTKVELLEKNSFALPKIDVKDLEKELAEVSKLLKTRNKYENPANIRASLKIYENLKARIKEIRASLNIYCKRRNSALGEALINYMNSILARLRELDPAYTIAPKVTEKLRAISEEKDNFLNYCISLCERAEKVCADIDKFIKQESLRADALERKFCL